MVAKPDPAVIADIRARSAHHEAGHAVAVVLRGGEVVSISLANDWHTPEAIDWETPAGMTRTRQPQQIRPFTTFAGPWAEAMWAIEHDPDVDDLHEGLDYAWQGSFDGDGEAYEGYVDELTEAAEQLGFPLGRYRVWEDEWIEELEPLWPAVCAVAALLVDGQDVAHDDIAAAIGALPDDDV